jgi:aminotransferase
MRLPDSYFAKLRHDYQKRRDVFLPYLKEAGFRFTPPDGAYYVLAEYDRRGFEDDVAFARWLVEQGGVAAVPASSFFSPKDLGRHMIRFMFAKKEATLHEAGERLLRLPELLRSRSNS